MPLIRNKIVRRIVKGLLFTIASILVLFGILSLYVHYNKKDLLDKLRANISKNIRSDIRYRDADITVWRHFPFVGLHIYDIYVEDSVYRRPFFKMKEASCQISVLQYVLNKVEVRNVRFSNGLMHIFTDTASYTNKYLLRYKKEKPDKEGKDIKLDHASLNNVRVILENRKRNKLFDVLFRSFETEISELGDVFTFNIEQEAFVRSLGFNMTKGPYLGNQLLRTDMKIKFNSRKAELSFDDEVLNVNGQNYNITGNFILRDKGSFRLNIIAKEAVYSKLKDLLTPNIISKLEKFNFRKPINVTASIEGSLAYKTTPKVVVNWDVKQNTFITPVVEFANSSFSGSFINEKIKDSARTDENSEIAFKNFKGNWKDVYLFGDNITVTNLINPWLNLSLRSSTDFASLNNKLGLRTIQFLQGKASLNLHYSGILETDIGLLNKVQGDLQFSNAVIKYLPRNFTFNNCSGLISFSNNNLSVKNLECDLGKNHFVVNANGTNLSGLSAGDATKATITCNVYSPSVNISDFKALFSKRQKLAAKRNGQSLVHTTARIDDVMDNGSLLLNFSAGEIRYQNFAGRNLRARILFANNNLSIPQASLNHANGKLSLHADINDKGNYHSASAKVNLQNVEVSKVFHSFNNFGQDGIEAKNILGTLNTNSVINVSLDNSGSLIPGSIKGVVDFSLKNGALVNYEPLMNIKKSFLKNRDLSNLQFAELKNRLEVNGYKITINKMEIQSTAIAMFVDGLYDLKKTDSKINIQIPIKSLKQKDSTFIPENVGIDGKKGTSIYLEGKNDKEGKVKFGLNTTRTIRKIFSKQ